MQRALAPTASAFLTAAGLVALAATPPAHAQEKGGAAFVYVSMAPERKIQLFHLEGGEDKLTPVDAIAVEGAPGALAVDPQRKFLFASLRSNATLASFRIDFLTGRLKLLSTARLPNGENAVYLATDRTGHWLLSASYAAGKVVMHRINEDGTIQTPAMQTVETAKTAHSAVTDRDNRFVFVPHVSSNAVFQFRLDAALGKLTEGGKVPNGTDKAGPRHLAFHPTLNVAFTSDEQGNSITAYRFDSTDGLKPFQTLSTLPADFKGQNTTAEVKVHPSGKFVWVSNRGHDSLAGFAIDADSGKLMDLGQTPTVKTPRSFDISPDGRFVLAAGEGSGKLTVYQIDLSTGKLTPLQTCDVGESLTCVLAVKDFRIYATSFPKLPDLKWLGENQSEFKQKQKPQREFFDPDGWRFPFNVILKLPGGRVLVVVLGIAGCCCLVWRLVKWLNKEPTKPD